MEFSPHNPIVQLCIQGMHEEESGNVEQASTLFRQAMDRATNSLEKFLASYYIARQQTNVSEKLHWMETALQYVSEVNDEGVKGALPNLYRSMGRCYEDMHNSERAKEYFDQADAFSQHPTDKGPFYHGTKADLQIGDLLRAGGESNYQSDLRMNHIYFTALVNGAGLAAELAKGNNAPRVYIVEPTGAYENDPNVTDKKFPGNLTRSYRSTDPLKIVGEIRDWVRLTPEQLQHWKDRLAQNEGEIIN